MRRVSLCIFALIAVLSLTSCEKECVCVNLENGSSTPVYGVYSRQDCQDKEDFYNTLYDGYYFECYYEKKK
ncbi:MAG TPA: hypothetical protein IAD13_03975 [Bacteroidetes bacterium]|nr:hypothetical protein [Candidatus Limimorpha avicola]